MVLKNSHRKAMGFAFTPSVVHGQGQPNFYCAWLKGRGTGAWIKIAQMNPELN
jgi:hypothetical protein